MGFLVFFRSVGGFLSQGAGFHRARCSLWARCWEQAREFSGPVAACQQPAAIAARAQTDCSRPRKTPALPLCTPRMRALLPKTLPSHCLQGSGPKELCLPEPCHARKSTVRLREEVLGLGTRSLSLSHSPWGCQTGEFKSTFGCRMSLGIVPRFLQVSAAWEDCQVERWHA